MKARLLPLALAVSLGIGSMPVVSAMAAVQTSTPGFSNAAVTGSAVVAEAERFIGYPYAYTGDSPATGFSCIGFVWYVYRQLGMNIPGTTSSSVGAYPQVAESNLLPGDLVYFQGTVPGLFPSHVGIYIGGGKMIGADNPSYGVTISSLVNDPRDGNYWQDHYLSAERPWTGPASGRTGPILPRRHRVLYVKATSLDLRSGPSAAYTVVTVVPQGTRLTVEGWAPGWVRVRVNGTVGWVPRSGVHRDLGYQQTSIPVRSHVRPAMWRNAKSVYVYSLNVRTSASLTSPVVFTLVRGNRVAVLARYGGWAEIKTAHGVQGWVVARYLGRHRASVSSHRVYRVGRTPLRFGVNLRAAPGLSAAVVFTSNGSPVHVIRWTASWARVRLSTGAVGWVYRPFLGNGRYRAPRVARVRTVSRIGTVRVFRGGRLVTPGVNIHSGPGVGYSILGGTFSGMRVHVLGYSNGFARVRTSTGLTGWIGAGFINGRRFAPRSAGIRRSARSSGPHAIATIRVHSQAGLFGTVIGLLYAGEHVTLLGSSGGWDLIRLPTGGTGYVDAIYIRG